MSLPWVEHTCEGEVLGCVAITPDLMGGCYDQFFSPVRMEQRWFRGWRDLDYSAPRVQWLHTPLHGKAKGQGARLSKPKKKGTCPIRNSRGIAAQVWTTSVGFGQGVGHLPMSITRVRPCQRWEDVDRGIEVVLDEKGWRWASWGWVRDRTWTGSDHNKEYQRWYSDWGIQRVQRLLILGSTKDRVCNGMRGYGKELDGYRFDGEKEWQETTRQG